MKQMKKLPFTVAQTTQPARAKLGFSCTNPSASVKKVRWTVGAGGFDGRVHSCGGGGSDLRGR